MRVQRFLGGGKGRKVSTEILWDHNLFSPKGHDSEFRLSAVFLRPMPARPLPRPSVAQTLLAVSQHKILFKISFCLTPFFWIARKAHLPPGMNRHQTLSGEPWHILHFHVMSRRLIPCMVLCILGVHQIFLELELLSFNSQNCYFFSIEVVRWGCRWVSETPRPTMADVVDNIVRRSADHGLVAVYLCELPSVHWEFATPPP